MKKGSDWNNTHETLKNDKAIRHLRDTIEKHLDTYYPFSTNKKGFGNNWVANKIIHYLLNYYIVKKKLYRHDYRSDGRSYYYCIKCGKDYKK